MRRNRMITIAVTSVASLALTVPATAHAAPHAAPAAVVQAKPKPTPNPTFPTSWCSHKHYDSKGRVVGMFCGRHLTPYEHVTVLRKAGWRQNELVSALAVSHWEGGEWTDARHFNRSRSGAITSVDVSIWQINLKYHPKYRTWNLSDPVVASRAALRIYVEAGGRSKSAAKRRAAWNRWNAAKHAGALKPGTEAMQYASKATQQYGR